ncbi:STE24 endopeptidase [Angomonas deanei]|nr:STE24 endopeptidase [Angomonas deanei]|eukprot:EPY43064.1 STE24 endopeptidase [Angomonas deanei]
MNFYSSALYTAPLLGTWELYLLWRQRRVKSRTDSVPKDFEKVLTADEFADAQRYESDSLAVRIGCQIKDIAIGVLGVAFKVQSFLYKATRDVFALPEASFTHCLMYSVAGDLLTTLIDLPFAYYNTFVVEQKHGFNKQSKGDFFLDQLKWFLVRVTLFHTTQTWLIKFVFNRYGERFPLYLFSGFTTILILFSFIYPAVIMPMFNKFTPLNDDGPLYARIRDLAKSLNYPLKSVYEMDGSRRSGHSNAFLYGFWNNKSIVLFDTLLKQLNDDQILAVLSHELGHWYHNHTLKMLIVPVAQLYAICQGARTVIFNEEMYRQFGFDRVDPVVGFDIFAQVFLSPIMLLVGYGIVQYVKYNEYQADRFAVRKGYGKALKEALVVLLKENKKDCTQDPLYSLLHNTHPVPSERIRAIDAEMNKCA